LKPYFEKGTEFRIIFSKSACFNFSGVISKKHCKKLHVKTGIFLPNFDFWPKNNSGMNRPVKLKKYIIVYFIYQKLDIDNISMTIYYPEFTPYSSPEIGVISAPVKYRGAAWCWRRCDNGGQTWRQRKRLWRNWLRFQSIHHFGQGDSVSRFFSHHSYNDSIGEVIICQS
jgi:hypothetical protein